MGVEACVAIGVGVDVVRDVRFADGKDDGDGLVDGVGVGLAIGEDGLGEGEGLGVGEVGLGVCVGVGVGVGIGVFVGLGDGDREGVGVWFKIGKDAPEFLSEESKYTVNLYPCLVAPAPAKKAIMWPFAKV